QSQTCTGSVGDPIVNITFGSGSSFGPPLPANTTSSLGYVASTCPPDGNYSILNYTTGCFGNDVVWHTTYDHTGDVNGYFMLINASYQPSDFYIQTIDGLCSGTTYQFAAWMINMCSVTGTLPNITLTIEKTDGTILDTYQTGDIPIVNPVTWKQYGFNFTIPPNVSTVVLRMRNNAPGGVGNDVGLDDITFRPVGPDVSISSATSGSDTAMVCLNNTGNILLLSKVENCYFSTAYQWQISTNNGGTWMDIPRATADTYTRKPTAGGTYLYRLSVAEQNNIGVNTCRVSSNPFTVIVYQNDVRTINITASSNIICQGNAATFTAITTYGGSSPSFQWQLNGNPVGANSDTFTTSALTTGDVINCIFKSSIPCNTPAISNSITVTVSRKVTSIINQQICEGEAYEGYTTSGTYTNVFTGSNGCDSTRTLNLIVYPKLSSVFDTAICFGTSYNGYSEAGTYNLMYSSAHGCDSVHTINLKILPDINVNPYADTILCTGDSIVLAPGDFDSYLWQDGSIKSSFVVTHGGMYSVRVTNKCGTAIKNTLVNERACIIMFPNAFTPNNDGINDVFKILNAYHLTYFNCSIYNRWGQKIFESFDVTKGWDGAINGAPAGIGIYTWICNYTRAGSTNVIRLKGIVTLLK
ncbi:MAG: gliding motility-associated C-terminal domain-containing protein, partial [Bacteroidota bacterium]|nr:gliding motility-associated C-terminal domain-containing protein [Bacteroidota bacterium]